MDEIETRDCFTIGVSDRGLDIRNPEGQGVTLSATEALMLLDILKSEEAELRRIADSSSPMPMRIRF
ncbi:MAG: hypothetical protein ACQET7_08105 [Thermodesulfobacteriota bacterium]